MDAVENQETALQWLMHDRAPLRGLVWDLSSCSLGERGESSGVKDLNAGEPGKAGMERCRVSLLLRALLRCACPVVPHVWDTVFSQTLKYRNFSLICSNAVGNHESPLALIL